MNYAGRNIARFAAEGATMEAVTGGVEPDEEHGSVRPLRNTLSQLRLRELLTEVQDRVEQIVQGRK